MLDLVTEASTLGVLLEETRGVTGVVLGTAAGEVRGAVGSVRNSDASASAAAALTATLDAVGALLGLGALGVASIRSPSSSCVIARQSSALLVIELDPRRPLGELETKLCTLPWAPDHELLDGPAVNRVPTVPSPTRAATPRAPSAHVPSPPAPAHGAPPPALPNGAPQPQVTPARLHRVTPTPLPHQTPPLLHGTQPPAPQGVASPQVTASRPRHGTPPPLSHNGIPPLPHGVPPAAMHAGPPSPPQAVSSAPQHGGSPPLPHGTPPPRPHHATPPPLPHHGSPPLPPPPATPAMRPSAASAGGAGPAPSAPPDSGAAQVKAVGGGPAFAGALEEFSLPDLLEFLRNSHRTGLLVCSTSTGTGTVQLSRGMIISADSPNALDLREHFVTSPELAPELRRALATLPAECFGDEAIESALVTRDLVPRDEVERARVARIYSAFREMMSWSSGRFSFDPGVPIAANPGLALSAQTILMQIYQEQDEQDR